PTHMLGENDVVLRPFDEVPKARIGETCSLVFAYRARDLLIAARNELIRDLFAQRPALRNCQKVTLVLAPCILGQRSVIEPFGLPEAGPGDRNGLVESKCRDALDRRVGAWGKPPGDLGPSR